MSYLWLPVAVIIAATLLVLFLGWVAREGRRIVIVTVMLALTALYLLGRLGNDIYTWWVL